MAWLSNKKAEINIDTAKEKGFSVQEVQVDAANGGKQNMYVTVDKEGHRIILIQPSDSGMYRSALMSESISGSTLIVGHSNGQTLNGMNSGTVADLISNSGAWQKNMPIVIDACNAGRDLNGIGSQIASRLGVYLTAPTYFTWNYTLGLIGGGTIGTGSYEKVIGQAIPNILNQMPWRTFGTDGSAISLTPTPAGR